MSEIFLHIVSWYPKSGSWSLFLVAPTITREHPNELEKKYSICVPGWESLKSRHSRGFPSRPLLWFFKYCSRQMAWFWIQYITQRIAPYSTWIFKAILSCSHCPLCSRPLMMSRWKKWVMGLFVVAPTMNGGFPQPWLPRWECTYTQFWSQHD